MAEQAHRRRWLSGRSRRGSATPRGAPPRSSCTALLPSCGHVASYKEAGGGVQLSSRFTPQVDDLRERGREAPGRIMVSKRQRRVIPDVRSNHFPTPHTDFPKPSISPTPKTAPNGFSWCEGGTGRLGDCALAQKRHAGTALRVEAQGQRRYLMASVKRYPRAILSTPGTSGYRLSYKRVLRVAQTPQIGYLLTEVMKCLLLVVFSMDGM